MEIDLRLLRHAKSLAEHGHFGRAAESVGISQPALSRSIGVLEARVGARLFVRSSVGVEPTDAGRLLLERATELLARSDDLAREMKILRGLDLGDLTIGAGTYPAAISVAEAVARMVRRHPRIRLRLNGGNWGELLVLLRKREIDLAVADTSSVLGDPEIDTTPLRSRQGYLVVRRGHPLCGAPRPDLADVMAYPFAASSRLTSTLIEPLLQAASAPGAVPSVACESLSMVKTVVAGSDAVGLLPISVIGDELGRGELSVLPIVDRRLSGRFGVMRLTRRGVSPAAQAFQEILREVDDEVTAVETELAKRFVPTQADRPKRGARGTKSRPRA